MTNNQIAELHNKYFFEIKKFKHFLLKNNVYFNYLENIYKLSNIKNYYDFLNFLSRLKRLIKSDFEYTISDILMYSFGWTDSKEGYYFWSKLYDKALETKDIIC